MKYYTIKPEYLALWGEEVTTETIITTAELARIASEWDKTVEDLTSQLNEVQMQDAVAEHFIPVTDAVIRQEGAPAEAYTALDCIRDDEEPDEDGCVPLYELVYYSDAETTNYDEPNDIRITGYGWHIASQRRV